MWQLTLTLLGGNPRASAAAGAVYVLGKARARVHTVQWLYSVQCTPAGPGLWRHGHSDSYSYLQHPALLRSWDHHLDTTITITPPPNLWPPHPPPPWWLWQWIPPRWRLLLLPRWSAWEDKSVESVEINSSIMDSGETMRWLFNLGIS